jgi:hypothetical protein
MSAQESKKQNRPRTKAGRTLLVKPSNGNFDASIFEGMAGLTSKHHTEKSNSYFLVYTTAQEALNALKTIKNKSAQSARVKFAHYRIFFKVEGLTDSSDYNAVKTAHTEMINKLATGNQGGVLYYRLYRKENKYIGCGDMTVDTKEVFDKLLSDDELKTFKSDDFSGTHFRYKKINENQEHQQSNAADE